MSDSEYRELTDPKLVERDERNRLARLEKAQKASSEQKLKDWLAEPGGAPSDMPNLKGLQKIDDATFDQKEAEAEAAARGHFRNEMDELLFRAIQNQES